VDLGASFKRGFVMLKQHPSLLLPLFLFAFFAYFITLALLLHSAVPSLLTEYKNERLAYEAAHPITDTTTYFERQAQLQARDTAFQEYLKTQPLWGKLEELFTSTTAIKIGVYLVFLVLAWFYALSALFVAIKDLLASGGLHWPGALGETTRRFIPAVIGLSVLPSLVVLVPAGFAVAIIVVAGKTHPILGLLVAILGGLGILLWCFYAAVKLTLVSGAYFLDTKGALDAARTSWNHARGRFWTVALLLFLYVFISMLPSRLVGQFATQAGFWYLLEPTTALLVAVLVLGAIQAIIFSLANAYAATFFCDAYAELTKESTVTPQDVLRESSRV
jgi:hypothetical protein